MMLSVGENILMIYTFEVRAYFGIDYCLEHFREGWRDGERPIIYPRGNPSCIRGLPHLVSIAVVF